MSPCVDGRVLSPLFAMGERVPIVDARLPIARADEARALVAGDVMYGKVVLTIC
jgi:hypothetical protein